ncbi:hypothetical protein ACOMHN_031163 [Nucella lapillus]
MSSTADHDEDPEWSAVVVDNGTAMVRAGFCGDDEPRLQWSNLLATPRSEERYIGEEAQGPRGRLTLHFPIEGGMVKDWEAMGEVWEATFRDLNVDPTAMSVLMSDRPLIPKPHREQMTERMMETFQVPRFYVQSQGVQCMLASGRGIAVVLDCGEGATTVMPIEEMTIRPHAILKGVVTGADLTADLQTSLMQRGYDVMGEDRLEAVREVKESLCYVAEDYDREVNAARDTSCLEKRHRLPDGQLITLNEERIRVPEALFRPHLVGRCGQGVHQLVINSIMKCDIDSRCNMYVNIIPAGGSTCLPGFMKRLEREVRALVPSTMKVHVVTMADRKTASFVGGSITASLAIFQTCWITKHDYDEHGPTIVHRKCT